MKKINRHGIVAAKILADYNNNSSASSEYFTIEALEDGLTASLSTNACEYSLDGNTWNSLSAATNTPSVNTGDKIYFRGNLIPVLIGGIGTFTISKKCNVSGNIMSLLFGDNFEGQTDLSGKSYAFYGLFRNCTNIIDASQLILPATTLSDNCYASMFYECSSLVSAPVLPATDLNWNCYYFMFFKCKSLVSTPELPATTLADCCYDNMFRYCSSLVSAPELPATDLADSCYDSMFYGCSSLTTAPELPATTLSSNCYRTMFYNCSKLNYIKAMFTTTPSSTYTYNWVYGVSSTGTFVKSKDATWDVTGDNGIPSGWTVVNDGEENVNLIIFTINGTEYQAEEGMTWEEWVESEYNTSDYRITADGDVVTQDYVYVIGYRQEYIIPNNAYLLYPSNPYNGQ